MHPIEAVIFDWDGTLVDSKRALVASFRGTSAEVLGEPFPAEEDVERIVQVRGQEASKGSPAATASSTSGSSRSSTASTSPSRRRSSPSRARWRPWRGCVRPPTGSASPPRKARIRLDLGMERTAIGVLLRRHHQRRRGRHRQADPEQVAAAITALGAEPNRSLYAGDGPNDVLAGRGAGAITVAVSFGFHPEEARAAGPDHVIDSLAELVELAAIA